MLPSPYQQKIHVVMFNSYGCSSLFDNFKHQTAQERPCLTSNWQPQYWPTIDCAKHFFHLPSSNFELLLAHGVLTCFHRLIFQIGREDWPKLVSQSVFLLHLSSWGKKRIGDRKSLGRGLNVRGLLQTLFVILGPLIKKENDPYIYYIHGEIKVRGRKKKGSQTLFCSSDRDVVAN